MSIVCAHCGHECLEVAIHFISCNALNSLDTALFKGTKVRGVTNHMRHSPCLLDAVFSVQLATSCHLQETTIFCPFRTRVRLLKRQEGACVAGRAVIAFDSHPRAECGLGGAGPARRQVSAVGRRHPFRLCDGKGCAGAPRKAPHRPSCRNTFGVNVSSRF